jgi:NACHT domain
MHSQQKRKRGVLLTSQGLGKLHNTRQQAECNNDDNRKATLITLSTQTGLDPHTLCKIFNCTTRVDKKSLIKCFKAFNLALESGDYESASIPLAFVSQGSQTIKSDNTLETPADMELTNLAQFSAQPLTSQIQPYIDYSLAPDASVFYGRTTELETLHQWIQGDRCRIILLNGVEGIGKTLLSMKLAQQLQNKFEFVIWRSLYNAPPIETLLHQLNQFFSQQPELNMSASLNDQITQLINYLQASRCLLIFDNFETILHGCNPKQNSCNHCSGCYRPSYENYSNLLKHIAETCHQSCLMLTSREVPQEIRQYQGQCSSVRVLPLVGLHDNEVRGLLQHQGLFRGTQSHWNKLVAYYAGNPLILQIVGRTIQILFNGKIAQFLNHNPTVFGRIFNLFDQIFDRLSGDEITILITLAVQEKSVSFSKLRLLLLSFSTKTLLETLESLESRSLLTINNESYSIPPILTDYITEKYPSGKQNNINAVL